VPRQASCQPVPGAGYIAGGSPPVWANVLLTIFQAPSIRASVKKPVNDTVPQQPSSSSTAKAASRTCFDRDDARLVAAVDVHGLAVDHREQLADRLVIARPRDGAEHPRFRMECLAQSRAVAVAHALDVEIDRVGLTPPALSPSPPFLLSVGGAIARRACPQPHNDVIPQALAVVRLNAHRVSVAPEELTHDSEAPLSRMTRLTAAGLPRYAHVHVPPPDRARDVRRLRHGAESGPASAACRAPAGQAGRGWSGGRSPACRRRRRRSLGPIAPQCEHPSGNARHLGNVLDCPDQYASRPNFSRRRS
jgi:hypothetical protein